METKEDEAAELLSDLHRSIWETKTAPPTRRGRIGSASFKVESCTLSDEQWSEIVSAVESHGFPCVISCGVFGFGYGLVIYQPGRYPGVPVTHLITVTSKHIEGSKPPRDDKAWGMFEPLVYSEENKSKLRFFGLQEPEDRSHYEY